MPAQDFDRFRSFAERYIVARAALFRTGFEREDAWKATLDAKTIYGNVARMSIDAEPLEVEIAKIAGQMNGAGNTTQAGSSASPPGVTGPRTPSGQPGPMGPPGKSGRAPLKQYSGGFVPPHKEAPATPPWLRAIIDKIRAKEGTNGTP